LATHINPADICRQDFLFKEGIIMSDFITDSPVPSFSDVKVHDPSIFKVTDDNCDDKFRVVGTYIRSAKTGDFINWQIDSPGGTGFNHSKITYPSTIKYYPQDNPLSSVQTMEQQIADVMRGAHWDGIHFFASDIHRMPDGRFFHYYSLTSSWYCSAIGVAIADSADGLYITQGLFVRSGEAGGMRTPDNLRDYSNTASQIEPTNHPNCIDPQAFFDKTGKNFYLVYGSWSGGIFMFELDVSTGLPKAGSSMNVESNGYGRQLIATVHTAIEGPYIIYSPESDYYYLFVSYGGLRAAGDTEHNQGRYQIRMFRSRNPEGPYEDITTPASADNPVPLAAKNLHPVAGNVMDFRNYGIKIIGSYHFEHLIEENTLTDAIGKDGFLSPGHNSAYYDPDTKRYFIFHHTRFVGRDEDEHQVRVREMFLNEGGWLITAPFRYDGGTVRNFNTKQLEGIWKILSHEQDDNRETAFHKSQIYTFLSNGTITGPQTGTWELKPDGKTACITLGGKLYKGVFLRCYDEYHSVWVYAFTALSNNGITLWGVTRGIVTDLNVT
jgi:arabinan endo-1,5-alpha-L-arabinosidase